MHSSSLARRRALIGLAALGAAPWLRAQAFPSKPITVLVAFPAGGSADAQMRALAQGAEKLLGQPIVVENRPGALGLLGANAIARAQPDGYTLLQATQNIYRAPHVGRVQYDVHKLSYIVGVAENDHALFAPAASSLRSLKDIIAAAARQSASVTVGTTGIGSTGHLLLQAFAKQAGVRFNHVPYKGSPELSSALMGGHLDAAFMPVHEGHKVGDRLRMLAVFGEQRAAELPEVPTAREQGIDAGVKTTFGLVGPPGMPKETVRSLYEAFHAAATTPEYLAVLKKLGTKPWPKDPEAYTAWARDIVQREKQLVEEAGLSASN